MGVVSTITHDQFPRQGKDLGRRCHVVFHFDTDHQLEGTVVRDDVEPPGELIIQLDDGRVVRAVECAYAPYGPAAEPAQFFAPGSGP